MATLATVTFTWQDSEGKKYQSSYTRKTNNPTDGEVQALAADAQALTALGLVKATVSRDIDITGQADAPEAGSSRQRDASLVARTSTLRASLGKQYTFKLPQYKAALLGADGVADIADAAFDNFRENFDDGAGIAGVQGDWYVGNQAELIEDEPFIEGYQNKD